MGQPIQILMLWEAPRGYDVERPMRCPTELTTDSCTIPHALLDGVIPSERRGFGPMLLLAGHRVAVIKGGDRNKPDLGMHGNYSHLSFLCPERKHWIFNFRKRLD